MLTFKTKLLLAFIGFGLLVASAALVSAYKMEEIMIKANSIEKAEETFADRSKMFEHYVADLESVLHSIEQSLLFKRYLDNVCIDKWRVEALFLTLSDSSNKYMQIRFLDALGYERLRVDRKAQTDSPYLVPDDALQDKSGRYYFKALMELEDDEIWFSNLDLNIEHGKIERPIKPVLRIGKKVTYNGMVRGVLIINVFMEQFLGELVDSSLYDLYLIDKNGNFLVNPESGRSWSRYLKTGFSVEKDFTETGDCILNNPVCKEKNLFAADLLALKNSDGLKLIVQPELYTLQIQMKEQAKQMLYIVLALLLFAFPLAFLFSRTPVRLKEEVDEMNASLEEKVAEKTHEMKIFNTALEKKVKLRTEELEVSNAKLMEQATTDHLTGIPNRRFFFEMSERYLQFAHRKQRDLSLMIFDIDFFKNVNDTYGHQAGDEVLKHVVHLMVDALRKSDLLGRIGGEEFAVVLPESSLYEAELTAEKIRQKIMETPYVNDTLTIALTISIGVAKTLEDEQDVMQALSRADDALYMAKSQGRNQVVVVKDDLKI